MISGTDITVVLPVHNEAMNLPVICRELYTVLKTVSKSYEIIFVDDGSSDNSFRVLLGLKESFPDFKVIKLKKKSGQSIAILIGMIFSKGQIVVTLDSDLQNNPDDLPGFIDRLNQGYDLVCGWRKSRKDSFLMRVLPSIAGNFIFSKLYGIRVHDFGCTFKAYKRRLVVKITGFLYNGTHRLIPFIAKHFGFSISEIEISHRPRIFGKSKYNLSRFLKAPVDFIVIKYLITNNKTLFVIKFYAVFLVFYVLLFGIIILFNPAVYLLVFCISLLMFLFTFKFLQFIGPLKDAKWYIEKVID